MAGFCHLEYEDQVDHIHDIAPLSACQAGSTEFQIDSVESSVPHRRQFADPGRPIIFETVPVIRS
jgi:hypothetical protein